MNNTPGPSPQSPQAPSPATMASQHAARTHAQASPHSAANSAAQPETKAAAQQRKPGPNSQSESSTSVPNSTGMAKPGPRRPRPRPRRAVRPSGGPATPKTPADPAASAAPSASSADSAPQKQPDKAETVTKHPYVALTLQTTGIHPSTGRIVTIDAVAFDNAGDIGQRFHAVLKPDIDAGPHHLHGLTVADIEQAPAFSRVLKSLDKLIDGRTLVVHDIPYTWGFIVAEARRAMMTAARQNRARNRGRNKGKRRRQKVGHMPAPVRIIDTLATSYAQGVRSNDVRLRGVAKQNGLAAEPKATVERARRPEQETSREETELLIQLYQHQQRGPVRSYAPDDVRADRFGLQRSHVRVDAAEAPVQHHNPGKYEPGKELRRGMEIVVAPEILEDPDTIISALMREELNYSEKLTREASLVVCNVTTDLVGKAMHAQRKGIPLMSDAAFLDALTRIEDPTTAQPPARRQPPQKSGGNNQSKSQKRRRRRGGRGRGRRNSGGSAPKNNA
ncbi:exonuclease domain-containing protein [Corynebacterium sp. KPL4015]|uniref:exonuclease domain-containing protein n=2 Tax=Corynebacterium TaxID=1716 RepID=UPI00254F5253|nr:MULTISPECIES: exonuclease domain-containing protein [unclassified Corynebacterium]MDK8453168.1 exonuclease domain-containing protein [Corynebacterium sp. MSK084]MDK8492074.1 exonuclease domain-containing protein [Corynebacterium sp. MSK175]MDK8515046.1 exonuclease domain-containing protein [Corynebacterium sp. MSK123]MDK8548324.1 exonuclease domain-containing protein [Corynebacterium sp. MSK222]MDK8648094.1 exonuclease domain-containing protein [Corynebacterium sp. MSK082]